LPDAAALQLLDRRLDVLHRLVDPELGHVLAALGDRVGRVAELNAGLEMVEEARGERQVAAGGELVGDGLDVMVDPENLLDDHDTALRRAPRRGEVGADLASLGPKPNILTHEKSSRLRRHWTWYWRAVQPVHSEAVPCTFRSSSRAASPPV